MDEIRINGIRATGFHGVHDFERTDGQDFVVDISLQVAMWPAAASDDLSDTVNYSLIADEVMALLTGPSVNLIETLAERIAAQCFSHQLVQAATVTVHKPQAPIKVSVSDIAVQIHRERVDAVLALGSNLHDRLGFLQTAVTRLAHTPGIDVRAVSPIVETDPVGEVDQDDFLNAVITISTWLPAPQLLAICQGIEAQCGRQRTVVWGPRTLDIDIITYGDIECATNELVLPHPRAAQRAFVLAPWHQLDPTATLRTAAGWIAVVELLAQAGDRQGVRDYPDASLEIPS